MLLISCLIFRSHNLSLLIFHFFFQSTILFPINNSFSNQQNNSFHPFPNSLCSSYDNQKAPWHHMPQCLINQLSIFTHESIHNRFYYPVRYLTVFLYYSFFINPFYLTVFYRTFCIFHSSDSFPKQQNNWFHPFPNRLYFSFQFSYFVLLMIFLLSYPVRICCLLPKGTAVQKDREDC